MEEFLGSEEFAKYRQLLLKSMAEFISARFFGEEEDLREIRGAIKLMRQIIRIPLKIRQDDSVRRMIGVDFEGLKRHFAITELTSGLQLNPEKNNRLGE